VAPNQHWTSCYSPPSWPTNFLFETTERGLYFYVKSKLESDPTLIQRDSGMPLLLRSFFYNFVSEGTSMEHVETLQLLLELGANPNESYKGHTVWEYWVHCIHTHNSFSGWGLSVRLRIQEIFKLMLTWGADPTMSCLGESRAWQRIYPSPRTSKDVLVTFSSPGSPEEESWYLEHPQPHLLDGIDEETRWRESHSLTAVINDIFQDDPHLADELFELVSKLEAAKQSPRLSRNPRRGKRKAKG
jgi:hypothetical protein